VDAKGVPLVVDISEGNRHDCKLFERAQNKLEESEIIKVKQNKRYFLGDKGYDSEKIREVMKKMGYETIIAKRKRKANDVSLNKKEVKIYRKRIIVENSFSWLKRYAKVDRIYEKNKMSYEGVVNLAISMIIYNKR